MTDHRGGPDRGSPAVGDRWLRWLAGLAWGAMATLFTSFGLPLAMGALVLGVLLLKGDRRTAISGPLTGFGGAWLLWTRLQDQSATTTDAVGGWVVAFGLLPFVIGLALVAPLVADAFRGRAAGRRSG